MNRTLKLSMLVALALGITQALALELGQVQVKSALGQPLLAEIPLRASSADELKDLSIRLASSDAFTRAGITAPRTALPLQFSVVSAAGGQKFIKITSDTAVDNPYLDLLLEVDNHAGKSMREVAILLDPVSSRPMAAPTRSIAAAPRSQPISSVAPAATPTRPATVVNTPAPREGRYGPVHRGQTLSSIARDTALPGFDMAQMLLAYKQANPEAFSNDNINGLKSGVILRVPTAAQAQSIAMASAFAEVRRENNDWHTGAASKPVTVADAGTATKSSSSPTSSDNNRADRLALVPAKDGQGAGSAGSPTNESVGKLRQDLLRSQESAASLQQQGDDLSSRLKALTDINNNNTHLLSLKDSQIAQLQAQLASARNAAHLPPQPEVIPAPSASSNLTAAAGAAMPSQGIVAATGSSPSAPNTAMSPAVAPAASHAAASVVPSVAPVPRKTPMKPGPAHPGLHPAAVIEQPWYMQPWAWAAAAGAVLVLLLLALMDRRRKASMRVPTRSFSEMHRFDADQVPLVPAVDSEDADQDELLDQLAEHPEDVGLHLELVALYYSRRDVEHFEAAAEAMYAHINDPQQDEWQDVLRMGEDLVPGHPLFDHHEDVPAENEQTAYRRFDIDDYESIGEAPAAPVKAVVHPSLEPLSEDSFSFNLEPGSRDVAETVELGAASSNRLESHPLEPLNKDSFRFSLDPGGSDSAETVEPEIASLNRPESRPLEPLSEDSFRFNLNLGTSDAVEAGGPEIASLSKGESRPSLELSDEDSFGFNLGPNTGGSPRGKAFERAPSDEAVLVDPTIAADEPFLIEPAPAITDTHWNLEGAVPELSADFAPAIEDQAEEYGHSLDGFSDDPVDTKLDLARAYLDMGDAEGARAMLGEVMHEGTQMQRDTAEDLLDKID